MAKANSDIEGKVTYWWASERVEGSGAQWTLGADGARTYETIRLNKRDSSVTSTGTSVARSSTPGSIETLERGWGRVPVPPRKAGRHVGLTCWASAPARINDCQSPKVMG